jgi:hypothetical protein
MVRIRINKTFRKGTEPRYSNEIYVVTSAQGQRISLKIGKTLLESELLKVYGNTTSTTTNPIDIVNKENRTTRRIKQAGVSQQNILESNTHAITIILYDKPFAVELHHQNTLLFTHFTNNFHIMNVDGTESYICEYDISYRFCSDHNVIFANIGFGIIMP